MGKIMNGMEMQSALDYWKNVLNLMNWDIEVKIERAQKMRENCAGSVNWTLQKKMANICILDPIDYPDDLMSDQDMEKTLVHELLHLNLAPLHDDHSHGEHYELFEEWAINDISAALIALYRKRL